LKVLFINPPVRDFYNSPLRRLPLGLLYLAAVTKKRGHQVHLIDSGSIRKEQTCAPPSAAVETDLKTHALDSAPFSLFGRYRHFGPSYDEIEERVQEISPDVVGISSLFSPYARESKETAAAARRAAPKARIVMGGGHPSAFPETLLADPDIDCVVVGEGEGPFPDLVDSIAAGRDPSDIPGVAVLKNGSPSVKPSAFIPDLDSLPYPARELLDHDAYQQRGKRLTQILSSRGCPHKCAFCSAHLTAGKRFRARSPEAVVAEMKLCRDRFGTEIFDFEDDNMTLDRGRALRLAKLVRRTFGFRKIVLEALNGLSFTSLDSELIDALYEAGLNTLHLAPLTTESASLSAMNREGSLQRFLHTTEYAVSCGMSVTAYVMAGFPGQFLREIMTTLDRLAGEPVKICPSVFYPAAGSAIQKELLPDLDGGGLDVWDGMRSSCFPRMKGSLSAVALRTVFWMAHLADFAASLVPERDMPRLVAACSGAVAARAPSAPHPRGQPWIIRATQRLTGREKGVEAIAALLRTHQPHGVRLLRRGGKTGFWKYSVFPLPDLLEDRAFYRRWGIPGFRPRKELSSQG